MESFIEGETVRVKGEDFLFIVCGRAGEDRYWILGLDNVVRNVDGKTLERDNGRREHN